MPQFFYYAFHWLHLLLAQHNTIQLPQSPDFFRTFSAYNTPYEKIGNEVVTLDVPFDIPDSWEWVRLSTICTKLVDGDHNPPKGELQPTEYIMASSTNINEDRIVELEKVRYLSKEVFIKENERTSVEIGDIFFTSVGSLGRSCVYSGGLNICFQRSVSVISTLIFNYYLKYCLDSGYIQQKIVREATGTAQKGFYLNQLAKVLIPIPPEKEQHRIVSQIQKINPLILKYETIKETIDQFNVDFPEQLKKSILQWAVQGNLVPQDENDEPAEVLLKRIRAEKEALIKVGKIKRDKNESVIFRRDNSHYEKLNGIEHCIDEQLPFELPSNWCWSRAQSVLSISSGDGLTTREMDGGQYPVYGGNGITGYHSKYNVEEPTLVIGRVGFYCGSTHITEKYAWITDNAFITSFNNNLLEIKWLKLFLDASELRRKSSSTAQPVISGKTVYPLLIPIPPLREQLRIIEQYERIVKLIDF